MIGIYLYAIVAGAHELDLGPVGLPDGRAHATILADGDLAAVASDYLGPALAGLPTPTLLRYVAIYQRVIERAMAEHRVLPLKFGTVVASQAEARAMLGCYRERFRDAFERLGDTVEIEVTATWDLNLTITEMGRGPLIAALAMSAAARPPEESLATRIQVGKLIKDALDQRRREYRQRVVRDLAPLCADVQANALLSDEWVLNVAFLVRRPRLDEFYARVHRLDEAFGNGLRFRCIGPLPPYSFATVSLFQPRQDEIDGALQLLQLGRLTSTAEIEASYRRLATLYHPDHNPGDASASARFTALATARAQLRAYVNGQADDQHECDLTQGAVDAAPLLTIRRSEPQPV